MAQEVVYNFNPANKCLFILTIAGKIRVDGADINERDAIGFWKTDLVPVHCDTSAQFLIIETPIKRNNASALELNHSRITVR